MIYMRHDLKEATSTNGAGVVLFFFEIVVLFGGYPVLGFPTMETLSLRVAPIISSIVFSMFFQSLWMLSSIGNRPTTTTHTFGVMLAFRMTCRSAGHAVSSSGCGLAQSVLDDEDGGSRRGPPRINGGFQPWLSSGRYGGAAGVSSALDEQDDARSGKHAKEERRRDLDEDRD